MTSPFGRHPLLGARADLVKRTIRGTKSGNARNQRPTEVVPPMEGRVLVVSPHCDDAIFSIGAAIANHCRRGGTATIITVLAGNPASADLAGKWDALAGFSTSLEATIARRKEDKAACAIVGANAIHLDAEDEQYGGARADDQLGAALTEAASGHDEIFLPGYPLRHPDHAYVTRLALASLPKGALIRLYAEEPYTAWERRSAKQPESVGPVWASSVWGSLMADNIDHRVKTLAAAKYDSQLPLLAGDSSTRRTARQRASVLGLLWYETRQRGESATRRVDIGRLPITLPPEDNA